MPCYNCGVVFPPKKLQGPPGLCDNCQEDEEQYFLTKLDEDDKIDIDSVMRKSGKTPAVRYD